MLVLLWGLEADLPLTEVREELELLGVPVGFVDQRRIQETEIEMTIGETVDGCIRIGNESINLNEVNAAYLRPYETVRLPEIAAAGPESSIWQRAECFDDILASWSELTSALVINRLSASAANGSKPYQLQHILAAGWNVPETLVTNNADEAKRFWKHHGEVIYKSISGTRSRVARLRAEHMERFGDLAACPTQFQRYICGVDYRVHVVDDKVFACEVRCAADDYRYAIDDEAPVIEASSLPIDVEDRCRELAAAMNLPFAGIDLRRTPQGEWYCFEVNPSPAFSYYQHAAGQPIAQAVASLLASATQGQFAAAVSALANNSAQD